MATYAFAQNSFQVNGSTGHIRSMGNSPTAVVASGAGVGATCTIASATDSVGNVTLTPGTSPGGGLQCAVDFAATYGVTPVCHLVPSNNLTTVLAAVNGIYNTQTTTAMSIYFAGANVTAAGSYQWSYWCVEPTM